MCTIETLLLFLQANVLNHIHFKKFGGAGSISSPGGGPLQ